MQHRFFRISVALVAAALLASCTMKKQEAPPLSGPSEFGVSIALSVAPDMIFQDGASQSLVTINARGPNGEPVRNLSLRAEIAVDGTIMDFGSLSARNLVTGTDGRATVVYTAPPGPAGASASAGTAVQILVTPIGNDYANAVPRDVMIRLVPVGIIIPPDGLQPRFTFAPTQPTDHQQVFFDASTSQAPANNPITRFEWNFGDGERSSGRTVAHEFEDVGSYVVTLTVFDNFNRSASTSQPITVGQGVGPTASFTFSPSNPLPNQQVNFNATASRAAPGRQIVSYEWDFGDGRPGATGATVSRTFTSEANFVVTLTVTDDVGRSTTVSQSVPVKFPDEEELIAR